MPSVPTMLRLKLAAARAEGFTFVEAWPDALAAALGVSPAADLPEWKAILAAHVEDWRSAFERAASTALADALSQIDPDEHPAAAEGEQEESDAWWLDALPAEVADEAEWRELLPARAGVALAVVDPPEREGEGCEHCGGEVPASKSGPRARYCGRPCREAAKRERARQRADEIVLGRARAA